MTIAFIGGGNMARALIGGLISHGQPVEDMIVVEINPQAASQLETEFAIKVCGNVQQLKLNEISTLVLAVKPQQLPEVVKSLPSLSADHRVVSIAAGITTQALSSWLGGHRNIVRAMPNTPALIQQGISGLFALPEVIEEDRLHAQSLLTAVGSVVWVEKETQLDAVTALSGSGPAYFFWLMEEMEKIGKDLGLPENVAHKLVLQTALGSTMLANQSKDSLEELRQKVTSKGGTTEAALSVLWESHTADFFKQAIIAAQRRAEELGRSLSQG